MTQTTFLSGKVLKQSLTRFDGRPPADAPKLKRLMLPQGELAQVHDGEPGIRYLACIALLPGAIRGNHYHKIKNEYLYIISGRVQLVVQDLASGQRESMSLESGDLVFIPVSIAHAFRTLEQGQGIEFSTAEFDRSDVCAFGLISGN
jgi:mannose-6-phosphate isomerase-like protein (cupin superfamily)